MWIFVVSVASALIAWAAGGFMAILITRIPLSILARASAGGRYVGLAAGEPASPFRPASGRRSLSLAVEKLAAA